MAFQSDEAIQPGSMFRAEDGERNGRRIFSGRKHLTFALLILGMFSAVVAAFLFVLSAVVIFEREAEKREISSVSRVFENHKKGLLQEIERYAVSNAAYVNIDTNYSTAWVESRFGGDMAADFSHDLIVLLDRQKKPVFTNSSDSRSALAVEEKIVTGEVKTLVEQIAQSYLLGLETDQSGEIVFAGSLKDISGVVHVDLDGQIALVAAYAIAPDPGGITMVRDRPFVLLSVYPLHEVHLQEILAALSLGNLEVEEAIPADMIGIPIQNADEQVLAYLAWRPMAQASRIILASAPILSAALIAILAITLWILWQNFQAARQLARREQEVLFAAKHDALTGLARRDLFYEDASAVLSSQSESGGHVAVVYMDVDYLKQTNDAHGHVVGDRLLTMIVESLQKRVRSSDVIGRIGGDEFLLLLTDRASPEELVADVGELSRATNRQVDVDGHRLQASCSLGVALFPHHGDDLSALIRAADVALQRCKSEGRGQYKVFDRVMDDALREHQRMRDELKTALEEDEFVLFYQPLIDAKTEEVTFFEALIRWQHPERGLLGPDVFLPLSLEDGTINLIGDWVMRRAIEDASLWQTAGVTVNVCATQLVEENFVGKVSNLLAEYGLPPERLVLEITESVMMERPETIRGVFADLNERGIAVAIDDFGTGFSSLSYLHEYRFQKMKIDRSFVSRLETDADAGQIIHTMIGLANVLGMQVVAEGVEKEKQRDFLRKANCDYLQGYLFGRPAPLDGATRRSRLIA
ncbi:EAL domain-containing protein [Roseibium polysiphoniae]|uniref:putative bifunctional diguanylate cyclase/phosphodiesterase n=1 Tax=Roseibium polysiphoniae TaxID=2571221 RepID=UPI0032991B70